MKYKNITKVDSQETWFFIPKMLYYNAEARARFTASQ